ncbi:Rap1-interacting factor 1 N terminal-domain-containing protein [Bisporella sp. PMI_857]|nr:Rap1-interacting factor 1 N terminal-domain-containing protein [Bisporella sp. PMI_857]
MVPQASASRQLPGSLSIPRLPTPPREIHSSDPKHTNIERSLVKDFKSKSTTITPNSSAESPNTSALSRKKVNWIDSDDRYSSPVVAPVPNIGGKRPIKSILKPYNGNHVSALKLVPTKLSHPHAYPNLATMLESITQQLEGNDRQSRLDAYTTLSGSIQASENAPELRALKEKMGPLLKCMKRDLTAKTGSNIWDSSLIINDLKLLSSFLQKSAIAETLPADFWVYFVDYAIKMFQDSDISKEIIKHILFILGFQKCSSNVMNTERVSRLVSALHDIENFVKGKSIITGRIDVYRSLVRNSRSAMLANSDWVEDLFNSMLSSLRDTRSAAIQLGLESAATMGVEKKAIRIVMELFRGELVTDVAVVKFGDLYADRLKEMAIIPKRDNRTDRKEDLSQKAERLKKEEASASIPQVWIIPMLFIRGQKSTFEQWSFVSTWLTVIGKCFNSRDAQTRVEANVAWSRYIFAISPDEKTSPKLVSQLKSPFIDQLKRKSRSANPSRVRNSILSGIYFLFYYCFRPNSTPAQLEMYWDAYVSELIGKALTPANISDSPEQARQDLIDACRILTAMFETTPRPWSETRALDFSSPNGLTSPMSVNELPALDSKWLRKSATRVFPVMEPVLEKLFWDLSESSEPASCLFKAYITSIASPAAKEIKVPNEAMACVAGIFNFAYRIWHLGPSNMLSLALPSRSKSNDFLGSFRNIIITAITGLGPLHFTEKLLSISNQDTFVVIATPSHRPKSLRGEIQCPLHHLFVLLTKTCPSLVYDGSFSQMVRSIITPFFEARTTSKSQMELIQDLLALLPSENTEPCKLLWQVLAEFATRAIDTRDSSASNGSNGQPLGATYRNALRILEHGFDLSPQEPLPGWRKLFEALVASSTIDAGESGRAIAVVEPLAKALVQRSGVSSIAYCGMLVTKATYPKDRKTLDAARRKLWGILNNSKITGNDPYFHLYEIMRGALESSYASFRVDRNLDCINMLCAISSILNRCPDAVLDVVLEKLQSGLGNWLRDEHSNLGSDKVLFNAVANTWNIVCSRFPQIKHVDDYTKLLSSLEILLSSALESRHKSIVASSITLWNSTFGTYEDKLEYPERLVDVLLRLSPIADLKLPSFPQALESDVSADYRQPPTFEDTQDNGSHVLSLINVNNARAMKPTQSIDRSPYRRFTPEVRIMVPLSALNKKTIESTPEPAERKSKRRISTPKLRHDDSQIQFTTIESSPIPEATPDSQLLTDRQKEVKERQRADASMFPDIRSSPRPKTNSSRSLASSTSSKDLSLRRSASKTPLEPPRIERQTTPTPQPDFDAYIHSSPTPTRSVEAEINMSEIPSSPPESLRKPQVLNDMNDFDLPSSPPEISPEPTFNDSLYVVTSAQINPYIIEDDRTTPSISTSVVAMDNRDVNAIRDSPADSSHIENLTSRSPGKSMSDIRLDLAIPASQYQHPNEELLKTRGTPEPTKDIILDDMQTPKTPVFHDALESPIAPSSDKQTVEENFQDAISSPTQNTEHNISSSLSDFDQSGIMRLMAEVDQGSGRPREGQDRVRQEYHVLSEALKANSLGYLSNEDDFAPQDDAPRAHPATHFHGVAAENLISQGVSAKAHVSSSVASLIPETPGVQTSLKEWIIVDGERFDPDDTIIVEVPKDFERFPRMGRRRRFSPQKKRRSSGILIDNTVSKKLKLEEDDSRSLGRESVDSHCRNNQSLQRVYVANLNTTAPSLALPKPIQKRKPGRPRRSVSTPLSQIETASQSGPTPNEIQPAESVDRNTFFQSQSEIESATDAFTPNAEEQNVDTGAGLTAESEIGASIGGGTTSERLDTEFFAHSDMSEENAEMQDIENKSAEAETYSVDIEITKVGSAGKQSTGIAAPEPIESDAAIQAAYEEAALTPTSKHSQGLQVDRLSQTEVVMEASLEDRLQSLTADMRIASHTAEGLGAWEDQFISLMVDMRKASHPVEGLSTLEDKFMDAAVLCRMTRRSGTPLK